MANSKPQSQFNRLGTCAVCRITQAKYTCPGCGLITCSVACVKKHKVDQDCDGVRPRTRFSKLSSMTDFDIHQDYKLLEEVNRTVQVSQQETKKVSNKSGSYMPKRLYQLKSHLLKIGTRILYLPNSFQRHTKNRSYFNTWSGTVHWTLHLTFLNSEKLTIYEHKWPDNLPLRDLLMKFIQAKPEEITPSVYARLRCYREVAPNQINVLLKADKVPESNRTFYRLDVDKTLAQNLIGKTIVEFPQLFFAIQDFYRAKPVETKVGGNRSTSNSRWSKRCSLLLPDPGQQARFDDNSESECEEVEMQESLPKSSTYKDLILQN